ncbi:MAG: hypothetical protein SGJ09_06170 [Phycisphaerae bacterium]|nr:hypothetical protein [Phycisphaerae bacterium]
MGRSFDTASLRVGALLDFLEFAGSRGGWLGTGIDVVPSLFRPHVSGIEVTQGIQYFGAEQHLTNANDRGPDNSVRLVANKPAWARVYVRCGFAGDPVQLSGEIIVAHRTGPLLIDWVDVATLTPQMPGQALAKRDPSYTNERSALGASLNFIVPAAQMFGVVRMTARVWRASDAARSVIATYEETVDATMLQTLSLRGVFIAYDGPDPTTNPPTANVRLPAPTVADLQSTASWTLTTNPVESSGVFSSAGTMNWFAPLTGVATTPGGCSTEWTALNYWISLMKLNDGNRDDVIYYGLLPGSTPMANVGGCESSGVSAGPNGQTVTMAHEVGHGAGLAHGPCSVPGDPNYPAYEPYDANNSPTASIGEYGVDITNGTIHPPTDKDYMSYCSPPWISLYHHARLVGNARFNPRTVGTRHWAPPALVDPYLWPWEHIPDPAPWERTPGNVRLRAEKLVALVGIVNEDRVVEVKSVMRVEALQASSNVARTSMVAHLIGANGDVVARAPVMRLISRGCGSKCGCGCGGSDDGRHDDSGPYIFQALLPDLERGSALRIVAHTSENDQRREVWSRRAPSEVPTIAGFSVKVTRGAGVARWEMTGDRDCELQYSLQFSKDKGRSWNGLTVGTSATEHRFLLTDLPSGSVVFRLSVHDGFSSTTALSRPVVLPPRPPAISILHPREGPPLFAGLPMRLWGGVMTFDGSPVDRAACTWRVDDEDVAVGTDAFIVAPSEGEHRCTLSVMSTTGRTSVSVVFRTIGTTPLEYDGHAPGGCPDGLSDAQTSSAKRNRRITKKTTTKPQKRRR